jgi:protein-serine/threonine kinase
MFEENGLLGAMEITEGFLKRARSRWTIDHAANQPWVRDAIQVEGGLKFRDEDEGEEI